MVDAALKMSRQGGAIRLTLPAKVANDLGSLQKGLRSLAERLGHPSCATGCDILHLMAEREFAINEQLQVAPLAAGPHPDPWLPSDPVPWRTVTVAVADKVMGNIESLTKTIGLVVDKLGCRPCCSGFDILFQRELDLIAVDEQLAVKGLGRFR
jgi:hypothetical protein